MVKKILALILTGALLTMGIFTISACVGKPADWDALYEKAVSEWGYEGTQDEFVLAVVGRVDKKNDKGNAGKSAYQIYKKYHKHYVKMFNEGDSETLWVEDLLNNRLRLMKNDSFANDKVTVSIKPEFSGRDYTVGDFDMIDAVEVVLAHIVGGIYSYSVKIGNNGYRNVVNAVLVLEKVEFVGNVGVAGYE